MKKSKAVISPEAPAHLHPKRNVLIDAIVIFLVLALIGFFWWWGNRPKPEPVADVPQYSGQALLDAINKKYGQSDYLGAIKLLKGQKTINETGTQLLLAAAYINAGQSDKALPIYDKLDQAGKLNELDMAAAAEAADRAKQYQKAIDWYKKAKASANKQTTSLDQAAVYDYKITELQKKL